MARGKSSPSSSTTPARRLWTNTSPRATSRLRISIAPSCLRSSARLRLLRLTDMNVVLSSPQNGGAHARESSPRPGRSILTTSAPMSPRICVQNGPATFWVRSTTTIPLSGSATATSLPSGAWDLFGHLLRFTPSRMKGRPPGRGQRGRSMGYRRWLLALAVFACLLPGLVHAQSLTPLVLGWEQFFTITSETVAGRVKGYVTNESGFAVSRMRLLIDGLDASGKIVGQSIAWVPSPRPGPGGRIFFDEPAPPGNTHRVSVFSYGWVQSAMFDAP